MQRSLLSMANMVRVSICSFSFWGGRGGMGGGRQGGGGGRGRGEPLCRDSVMG